MKRSKSLFVAIPGILAGLIWLCWPQQPGLADQGAKYVGTETCATCHADIAKKWQLTVHRNTLFNKEASRQGCEACHGPGGDHVAGGGDKSKIIRFSQLKPEESNAICQKCHTQQEVYESPEVLSFGDLDFEPMNFVCATSVTCDTYIIACIRQIARCLGDYSKTQLIVCDGLGSKVLGEAPYLPASLSKELKWLRMATTR